MNDKTLEPSESETVSETQLLEDEGQKLWEAVQAEKSAAPGSPEVDLPARPDPSATEDDGEQGNKAEKAAPPRSSGKDIWNDVPDTVKLEFEKLKAKNEKLKRVNTEDQKRLAAARARLEALQPQTQANGGTGRAVDPLGTLIRDYPDVAEPVRQAISALESKVDRLSYNDDVRGRVDIATVNAGEQERMAYREMQRGIVAQTVPGGIELVEANQQAYADWVEDQPKHIREAAYRNGQWMEDAQEGIALISAFQKHFTGQSSANAQPSSQNQTADDRRERQKAAMTSVQSPRLQPTVSGIPREGDGAAIWAAIQRQKKQSR